MGINFVIDIAIFVVGAISTINVIEYVVFVIEIGFYFFCLRIHEKHAFVKSDKN